MPGCRVPPPTSCGKRDGQGGCRPSAGENLPARLLLQVHDELVLEVPEAQIEETTALVRRTMENTVNLGVPLLVEAGAGHNWGEAH